MNRKSFLRNCLMACAISILPKSLLPSTGEIIEEEKYFPGIIHLIEKHATVTYYAPGNLTLSMLEELGNNFIK